MASYDVGIASCDVGMVSCDIGLASYAVGLASCDVGMTSCVEVFQENSWCSVIVTCAPFSLWFTLAC